MIKTLSIENAVIKTAAQQTAATDRRGHKHTHVPSSLTDTAMTWLVDEYGGAVYKFCRSITYTKDDADDLFQDTFLNVFSQMPKLGRAENPQSFLLGTAAYLWKSKRRKYARRSRIAPEAPIDETVGILTASMEDELIARDEERVVRGLVDKLPERLKIPIVLYYTNGLGVKEIAKTLNIPAGTVKSRLYKAREIIRKGLVKEYGYQ